MGRRKLAIASRKNDGRGIFLKTLDGRERLLVATPPGVTVIRNPAWSPDGTELAYSVQTGAQNDIWVLTMGELPTTRPFQTGAAAEYSPSFSPDGRWLAYQSNESGRSEVYVQAYPQGVDAGVVTMMAVSVTADGASLRLGTPTPLALRAPGSYRRVRGNAQRLQRTPYDVLPDGRFVMIGGAVSPARGDRARAALVRRADAPRAQARPINMVNYRPIWR